MRPGIIAARPAGAGYIAKAVNFDGATYLSRDTGFVATNGPRGFFSFWAKAAPDTPGFYQGLLETAGFCVDLRPLINLPIDHAVGMILAEPTFTNWIDFVTPNGVYEDDEWYGVLMAWDVDFDAGSRRLAIYVGDAPTMLTSVEDAGVAFDINYQDAPVYVGVFSPPAASTGDLADLFFNTTTSIVETDGTITEANRRNFIDALGKPVDPAVAVAAYGAPTLLMSGGASGFAVNQGTGGDFVVTGTLTDASTSPSN